MKPKYCVYIVDDSTDLRRLLKVKLEKAGFAVKEFEDGNQAFKTIIEDLKKGRALPALVISDVNMPIMSGLEMVARLRMLYTGFTKIPIFIYSSEKEVPDYHHSPEFNTYFLNKSSGPQALVDYIKNKLAINRSTRAHVS